MKPKKKTGLIVAVVVLALAVIAAIVGFIVLGSSSPSSSAENSAPEYAKEEVQEPEAAETAKEEEPEVIEHLVVFETSGGTTYEQTKALDGSIITTPAEPVRPGYIFEGWFSDKECTKPFEFPHTVEVADPATICIYAKWAEEKAVDPEVEASMGMEDEYGITLGENGNHAYWSVFADCIFPQSSYEYLTYDDVRYLDVDQVQRAINEIFARNGYIFQSSETERDFFESQDWYYGTETDPDVVSAGFNECEKENMRLLQEHRASL